MLFNGHPPLHGSPWNGTLFFPRLGLVRQLLYALGMPCPLLGHLGLIGKHPLGLLL